MVALDLSTSKETMFQVKRIKILCLSIWYPLSISRYFEKALRRNPDIELITAGVFTGSWIPWLGGVTLLDKYSKAPEIPLPFPPNIGRVDYNFVKAQLPKDWIPDLVLCIDAGITWTHKPQDGYVATIATDPHALNYDYQRKNSDKFFNMQLCYSESGDVYLPYAYSSYDHYPQGRKIWKRGQYAAAEEIPQDTDAILIGMPYENRIKWVDELRKHGVSVIFENKPVFDEYRELANRARIGLNWSSMNDLNARFFETPAFGLAMVTNRVSDAGLFLTEGIDYLGFDDFADAISKVMWLQKNPDEIERIAKSGHEKIQGQTYDSRVETILKECRFL